MEKNDLLLCGVEDSLDPEYKQFCINGVPVCYNFVKSLFGFSNNLLIGIKGTQYVQEHIGLNASRPSRTGLPAHKFDFTKHEEVVLWLNYQRQF